MSIAKTMMQALQLLRLVKGMLWTIATLNSKEIKPVAPAGIELCLSENEVS